MLRVMFGDLGWDADRIEKPNEYFNFEHEKNWCDSELAKAIIRDVDLSEHIKDEYVESPIYGGMPVTKLSSGCKALLILLNQDNVIMNGARMGDNCSKWLLEIAKIKDITITLDHSMKFPEPFEILSVNSGIILHTQKELFYEMIRQRKEEDD